MADLVLMEKGPATMNVPADKVSDWEAQGWVVIKRPAETIIPKAVDVDEPKASESKPRASSRGAKAQGN